MKICIKYEYIFNHVHFILFQCTADSCTSVLTKPYCSTENSKAIGDVGICIACQAVSDGSGGAGDGTGKVLIGTILDFISWKSN